MTCCPETCEYINIGSSHYVNATSFQDADGNNLTSATGTWTLYQMEDDTTVIASGNMTLVTEANYRGTISAAVTAELIPETYYTVRVSLTQSQITTVADEYVLARRGRA